MIRVSFSNLTFVRIFERFIFYNWIRPLYCDCLIGHEGHVSQPMRAASEVPSHRTSYHFNRGPIHKKKIVLKIVLRIVLRCNFDCDIWQLLKFSPFPCVRNLNTMFDTILKTIFSTMFFMWIGPQLPSLTPQLAYPLALQLLRSTQDAALTALADKQYG